MSDIKMEESCDSFNAASDANDSLEPGELKLTPPRSPQALVASTPALNEEKVADIRNNDNGYRKNNDDGSFYDNKRFYQNNRRSPHKHNRYQSYGGPKYRNLHFKNRSPPRNRNYYLGKNRNYDNRNHLINETDHHTDESKHNSFKSSSMRYTETKPVIQWTVNSRSVEILSKSKTKSSDSDLKKVTESKNTISDNLKQNSENRDAKNSNNREKHDRSPDRNDKRDSTNKNQNKEEEIKSSKKSRRKSPLRNTIQTECKVKVECDNKSKTLSDSSKATTPELELRNKRKRTKSNSSSSKKKKLIEVKTKNVQASLKLSFADDLNFENEASNDIFPLSKDESVCVEVASKKLKKKSNRNGDNSPDTDEYQDMWEEDADLTSSQGTSVDKKTNEYSKKCLNKIKEESSTNENIKIDKDGTKEEKISLGEKCIDKTRDKKKFIEDIFDDTSPVNESNLYEKIKEQKENESEDDIDKKDGFSTPIFVNPSPPPNMQLGESKSSPTVEKTILNNIEASKISITPTTVDDLESKNEPVINPNQKFLFGMQDIYEQFIQSVSSAGIDISCNDSTAKLSSKENKMPAKQIISPLELEATPSTQLPCALNTNNPITEVQIQNDLLEKEKTENSSSASSSSSSDSSDTSSTSSTSSDTSSNSSSSDNSKNDDLITRNYSKEDRKKLRALEKRLETLNSWSAMDDDELQCFEGLKRVLEREINLLKRKYLDIELGKVSQSPNKSKENEISAKEVEKNNILDANRDIIKIKISPKISAIPNKILNVPVAQIFSIEEEIAKANRAETLVKEQKKYNEEQNRIKNKTESDHNSSRSSKHRRSSEYRSPEKHNRDSNKESNSSRRDYSSSGSSSPGRNRRGSSPSYSTSNKRNSSFVHAPVRNRRKNYRSRSRSHSPPRKQIDSPPHWKKSRGRDTKNKSHCERDRRGRSNSSSNSISPHLPRRRSISPYLPRRRSISPYLPRRRSISPYLPRRRSNSPLDMFHRYSRSPQFRPPSPPSTLNNRRSIERSRTRSRSRSRTCTKTISRLSPSHWNRDDINCSQYYPNEEYSYGSLSPNRVSLDARINQELNNRSIGTPIHSYQSYTQFNSYNDYMPVMQANSAPLHFNSGLYGYQPEYNSSGNLNQGFESNYFYPNLNPVPINTIPNTEFQHNITVETVPIESSECKNGANLVSSVAVQKGNVLEIVPASNIPTGDISTDTKNKSAEEAKTLVEKKKKISSWKEEVNRRQVLCAVLKLNRENDVTMKSILTVNSEIKIKEKKSVLFADGIRPGHGPTDDKSKVYKKEKRPKKEDRNKNNLQDNKENENLKDAINTESKVDADLENAPPPPPPSGSPPPYLIQPRLIRAASPEQLLYFHYDPVVMSMYVSQIPIPIPPRLLNRNQNAALQPPNMNGNSAVKQPQHHQIDKSGHTINHPRIPTIVGGGITGFNRFNNSQTFSKNFSMPPPTFQPRSFSPLPPQMIKRTTAPPPFNPIVPPPVNENTPAFSSDSTLTTGVFFNKKEPTVVPPVTVQSPAGGVQQFLRNEIKSNSNSPTVSPSV